MFSTEVIAIGGVLVFFILLWTYVFFRCPQIGDIWILREEIVPLNNGSTVMVADEYKGWIIFTKTGFDTESLIRKDFIKKYKKGMRGELL